LGEKISDWKTCAKLVKTIATNFKIPYFTISPTYSICRTHGYLQGEQFICPTCSQETEVYSRITGYYRPIKHWNDGKQSEYLMRTEYSKYADYNKCDEDFSVFVNKYLFTTDTCPKCPEAKNMLEKDDTVIFINANEAMDQALEYNIRSVPSLVVVDENKKFKVYTGINGISEYLSL